MLPVPRADRSARRGALCFEASPPEGCCNREENQFKECECENEIQYSQKGCNPKAKVTHSNLPQEKFLGQVAFCLSWYWDGISPVTFYRVSRLVNVYPTGVVPGFEEITTGLTPKLNNPLTLVHLEFPSDNS